MKKSLEELKAIRDKKKAELGLRKGKNGYKVVVGMATCGIAAGARPLVDVIDPDGGKVTYVHMTPDKMSRVIEEHVIGGTPVRDYTMNILDGQIIDPVVRED